VVVVAIAVSPAATAGGSTGPDDDLASRIALQKSDLSTPWTGSPGSASSLPFETEISNCIQSNPNKHMTGTAVGDDFLNGGFPGFIGSNNGLRIESTVQIAQTPAEAQQDFKLVRSAKYGGCETDAVKSEDTRAVAKGIGKGEVTVDPEVTAKPADYGLDPNQSWVVTQHELVSATFGQQPTDDVTAFIVVGRAEINVTLWSYYDSTPNNPKLPPASTLRKAALAMIARAKSLVPGQAAPSQMATRGPSKPCVAIEATGDESVDLNGGVGVGKVGEAGLGSGAGLTVVGQRLSDLTGTVSLVQDDSAGPLLGINLAHEVGGEPAAKATGKLASIARHVAGTGPELDLSGELASETGAGRLWDFASIPETLDFINQAGDWYGSHSFVFLPVLHDLVSPYDQLPPPDETWLTQSTSLKLAADASDNLLVLSGRKNVPLATMTDARLLWQGQPSQRSLQAILVDYQIPTATGSIVDEPLSPPSDQVSGTLEEKIPVSNLKTTGAPSEVTVSLEAAGDLTNAASFSLGGVLGGKKNNAKGGGPSLGHSEDASRLEVKLPLDAKSLPIFARFWSALETQNSQQLPAAEQALLALVTKPGIKDSSMTITKYKIQASSDAPFSVQGQYDIFTASAEAAASNEFMNLTGARYWDTGTQKWVPWTACTQGPGTALLQLSPSA
jgi:hypothetical protein